MLFVGLQAIPVFDSKRTGYTRFWLLPKFLRRGVVDTTAVRYTLVVDIFPQLDKVRLAETFESWTSEKRVNSKENTKKKHDLGLLGHDCHT